VPPAAPLLPADEADLQDKTLRSVAPYRDRRGRGCAMFATPAHHEDALRRFLVFSNHVLGKDTLPMRSITHQASVPAPLAAH
jgi:4-carboxymuconolactone decarboxylase